MPATSSPYSCRMCGASSYRRAITRDEFGAMRANGLFQCSGCSVVFTDPKAWRNGDGACLPRTAPLSPPQRCVSGTSANAQAPRAPNLATYGVGRRPDPTAA